jgi:putative PEP-CTERM system TPR-repeat lipoprotein
VSAEVVKKVLLACAAATLFAGCGNKSEGDSIAAAKQFLEKRDTASAVIELKSALQKSPNLGEARYLLGVALLDQGDCPAALLELGKAQELGFDDNLLLPKLARCQLFTGKFKEVVQAYAGSKLKSASAQAELATAVALAHLALNQRAEAEASISEALKSDPKLPWALLTKARFVAAAGKIDEALALVDQAIVPSSPSGDAYLLRGTLLRYAKKDVDGAIKAYLESAKDPKEVIPARTALIQAYLAQRKLPEAKAQLSELQKSHPKNANTHYLDAILSYAGKDYARSESITEQLLGVAPNNPQLLVLGGAASLQRGNLIAAETKLGKVVQTVERMSVARKLLAETYLRMGRADRALATLQPLLEKAKPDGDALALAGQAHLQSGHAQEAEAMFSAAVKLKPEDVQVRTALALTDLVKGNSDAAFDALQEIAAKDAGETADLALISAHLRRREFDAALGAITLLEKKQPGKAIPAHLRGIALMGKADSAGARLAFEAALKVEPKHFASVASLAALDLQDKKPEAARQRLDAAIKLDPTNVAARMALLNLLRSQKAKPEDLLAVIDGAIAAAPAEAAPRVARIVQLSLMNDAKAAALAGQNAMAALPQDPDVLDAAGRALANAGDDLQALSAFNKLASVAPRSALPYLRLADVHASRGDASAVAANLGRAFDVAPESAEVQKRLLEQAVKTRDFKPVLAAARELQKRFPHSAAGFVLEGDAEAARKDWAAALAAYRGALNATDGGGRPQKLIFTTLRASGDKAGADRFAADWLTANRKDAGFREYLGNDAILRKDFGEAERHLREALALQPRNGALINNLAWLMAERGDKGAVAMAEKALALAPSAAPVLDTLAKALASEGQFERAIDVQKKAIAVMPDRHQYRLNLAKHLIKAGQVAEARRELDSLRRLEVKAQLQTEVEELREDLIRNKKAGGSD